LIARLSSLEATPRWFEGFVTSIMPKLQGSLVVARASGSIATGALG
jgi:hypothetical protein